MLPYLTSCILQWTLHPPAIAHPNQHAHTCTWCHVLPNHSLLKASNGGCVGRENAHSTITVALFLGLQPAFVSGELGTRLLPNCRGFLAYPSVIPQQPYSRNVCIPTLIHTLNITHYGFPLWYQVWQRCKDCPLHWSSEALAAPLPSCGGLGDPLPWHVLLADCCPGLHQEMVASLLQCRASMCKQAISDTIIHNLR